MSVKSNAHARDKPIKGDTNNNTIKPIRVALGTAIMRLKSAVVRGKPLANISENMVRGITTFINDSESSTYWVSLYFYGCQVINMLVFKVVFLKTI